MNARSLSFRPAVSAPAIRAHLSPLTSRVLRGAGERVRPVTALTPAAWNARILDRLTVPLTRFHD